MGRITTTRRRVDDTQRFLALFTGGDTVAGDEAVRQAFAAIRELDHLIDEIKAEQVRRRSTDEQHQTYDPKQDV
jgi:hypothetical protein